MNKFLPLFLVGVCVFGLSSCDVEDDTHVQGVVEAEGKWANIGQGTLTFKVVDGVHTLVDDFKADYVSTYQNATDLKIEKVSRVSTTSFTVQFSGTIKQHDYDINGIVVNKKGITGGESNYLAVFLKTDKAIEIVGTGSSSTLESETDVRKLVVYNGGTWVESAINTTNVTVASNNDATYPISATSLTAKIEDDLLVVAFTHPKDVAHSNYSLAIAAATNTLGATYSEAL
jgi:hypothetical protein